MVHRGAYQRFSVLLLGLQCLLMSQPLDLCQVLVDHSGLVNAQVYIVDQDGIVHGIVAEELLTLDPTFQ